MLKRTTIIILLCFTGFVTSLFAQDKPEGFYAPSITHYVKFETNKGAFTIGLYNETPRHRDNFLRLVRSHAYEGVLFHRTINRFMVQTGNLSTKNATKNTDVSADSTTQTLEQEINPKLLFHKRGAVAAARTSDDVNPLKASSATQFYIVTGNYYTDWDLNDLEKEHDKKFTPYQRDVYKTQGGVPYLDGDYTVFGEVVDGYNTIKAIERVKTDDRNRPQKDIVIKRVTEVEHP